MYKVYIISKGRWDKCYTADLMVKSCIDFKIVVEPQEVEQYADVYGYDKILQTDFSNLGKGPAPARNFARQYSLNNGEEFHWQLDDNIKGVYEYENGKGKLSYPREAMEYAEELSRSYINVDIIGLTNKAFAFARKKPAGVNVNVYCFFLFNNNCKYNWRNILGDDTDMALQVVTDNRCTICIYKYAIDKAATSSMKGGNADLYVDDFHLRRYKQLHDLHGDIVELRKRFGVEKYYVNWSRFKHRLIEAL